MRPNPEPSFLRPFFSYFGGKWRDTPKLYPRPRFDRIVEPFAGSAGYALRYYDRRVVLCEVDPQIYEVWRYLIRVRASEILALPDIENHQSVDELNVVEEAKWLIGLWLNRGASSPRKHPSKWMRDGIRPGSFWGKRVRNTIARQVDHIRHWQIHNISYVDCPVSGSATWFVDPPYQEAGSHYPFGSDRIDYDHLGNWCRALRGQVIVCEASGADWLPFSPLADTKTTRAGSRSAEAVWLGA